MSVDVDFRDFFMRFLFISCHWCVCKSHFVWIYMCIADVKWISRLRNLVNKRHKLPFAWNANLTRIYIFFFFSLLFFFYFLSFVFLIFNFFLFSSHFSYLPCNYDVHSKYGLDTLCYISIEDCCGHTSHKLGLLLLW